MAANVADPITAAPPVESTLPIDRYHVTDLELFDLGVRARIYTTARGFNLLRDGDEKKEADIKNS